MAHIIRFGARKGTERNKPLFVICKKEEKEGRELSIRAVVWPCQQCASSVAGPAVTLGRGPLENQAESRKDLL
jgi:ribosomal protein L37AE/L43A